jgi:hypothetical protein
MMGASRATGRASRRKSLGSLPLLLLSPGASAVAWALIHGSPRTGAAG